MDEGFGAGLGEGVVGVGHASPRYHHEGNVENFNDYPPVLFPKLVPNIVWGPLPLQPVILFWVFTHLLLRDSYIVPGVLFFS